VLLAIVLIAAQAFVLSQLGFRIGSHVKDAVREGAQRLAGVVLLLLGVCLGVARLMSIQV
jgi:manganese efflux pump family protein